MSKTFLIEQEEIKGKRNGTKTSSFGTPGRINHDSSSFYNSKLYQGLENGGNVKYTENKIKSENINKIFCKSSAQMDELPDNSVHLMVTSPPYQTGSDGCFLRIRKKIALR